MTNRLIFLALGLTALIFTSCQKTPVSSVTVTISDSGAPVSYDEVVIDLSRVEVKYDNVNTNNEYGKYFLDANARLYDLAALHDSDNTEIALKKRMPTGTLTEIRLVVGNESYVKVNGVKHDLVISNAPTSGLTLSLDDVGVYDGQEAKIKLNIDVAASVQASGGTYSFVPVMEVQ